MALQLNFYDGQSFSHKQFFSFCFCFYFFFYDTKIFKSFYDGPHKFIVLKIKLFALMFTIKIIVTY